jgi:hypothetical protein
MVRHTSVIGDSGADGLLLSPDDILRARLKTLGMTHLMHLWNYLESSRIRSVRTSFQSKCWCVRQMGLFVFGPNVVGVGLVKDWRVYDVGGQRSQVSYPPRILLLC